MKYDSGDNFEVSVLYQMVEVEIKLNSENEFRINVSDLYQMVEV